MYENEYVRILNTRKDDYQRYLHLNYEAFKSAHGLGVLKLDELRGLLDEIKTDPDYENFKRLSNTRYARNKKLKAHVKQWVKDGCQICFYTLTFSDEALQKFSKRTRRIYVSRYLHSLPGAIHYVANIDYGDETEREHYHALVAFPSDLKLPFLNRYRYGHWESWDLDWTSPNGNPVGFAKVKECGLSETDLTKLAKYTGKLAAHGVKLSGKGERFIWSRS